MKKFYISTPIYYASGKPHIGHAYTTIMADAIAKYKKLIGYDVFFVTGMDEHGQKIEKNANNKKISCIDFVEENSKIFLDLWKKLNIDFSCFIRTTNEIHKEYVQKIFSFLLENDFLYLDTWKSKYCLDCEESINESEIKIIDNQYFCLIGHKLIDKNEITYFLKVTKFKEWIIDIIKRNKITIYPESRKNEIINSFLENNFIDLSVTRTGFDWGIKVKEKNDLVIYVWFDALLSYLSSIMVANLNIGDYWNEKYEKVHLLSKEITRFHCIYWPIMLKMINLPLPNKIISHGWIITNEGKMSKSIGNIIDPFDLLKKYNSDTIKYYLLKEFIVKNDNIFSEENLINCYNNSLANKYGNIVSRTHGIIKKYLKNNNQYIETNNEINKKYKIILTNLCNNFVPTVNEININKIINLIEEIERNINLYIDEFKPWKNNNDDEIDEFIWILHHYVENVIWMLSPVITEKTNDAASIFNINLNEININNLNDINRTKKITINDNIILFKRI